MHRHIELRGARTHNLKNVNLTLPREQLIVMTGLSGSGKSSLAFDTIYAEGQRRYVESLSAYARQFLSMMEKPDLDHIEGLSPAISIEQKSTSHNPRSTVGTVTEIYDYLRLLFARAGVPHCPDHGEVLDAQNVSQMVDQVLSLPQETRLMLLAPVISDRKGEHAQVLANLQAQGYVRVRIDGVVREFGDAIELDPKKRHTIEAVVDRFKVRDNLQQRLAESFETALQLADGNARIVAMDPDTDLSVSGVAAVEGSGGQELVFSDRFACPICGYSVPELEPRLFSFNNPAGACPTCDGLGVKQFFDPERVIINDELSLAGGAIRGWDRKTTYYFGIIQSLGEHFGFDVETPFNALTQTQRDAVLYGSGRKKIEFRYHTSDGETITRRHPFEGVLPNLERRYRETESAAVREELARYLNQQVCPDCHGTRLNRAARHVLVAGESLPNISARGIAAARQWFSELALDGWRGEVAERIVKEIASRLGFLDDVGLSYLTLDRRAETLSGGEAQRIRLASQIGSGLVGVMYILDEPSIGLHQRDNERLLGTLRHLRDIGNTVIVVEHDEDAIRAADYVVDLGPGAGAHGGEVVASGTPEDIMANPKSLTGQFLSGAQAIEVPTTRARAAGRKPICIRGAEGNNLKAVNIDIPAGIMTCVTGVSGSGKSTLINATLYPSAANAINRASHEIAPVGSIRGLGQFDRVIDISQSPIGRTPRSNPATYSGLFTPIRELFAGTQEARARGYKPGRFSFNVKGGRCESCQGDGVIKVEMHFLPDVYVPCDVCKGQRYNRETLEILYKGRSIADVLSMTVEDALAFFKNVPTLKRKLQTLMDVGLSYVTLGQNAVTLSGGEAQRVKLARELSKRDTGSTLYILDEPTTGLHFADIRQLLGVLQELRDRGNTIIVIEHNLDVIKTADWIIDLGPDGGDGGGEVVATGTPEDVAANPASVTGRFLGPLLPANTESQSA
ncbi:MAG: excinuclease ABC subunit UvrA [Pseudomonadota bacterium]